MVIIIVIINFIKPLLSLIIVIKEIISDLFSKLLFDRIILIIKFIIHLMVFKIIIISLWAIFSNFDTISRQFKYFYLHSFGKFNFFQFKYFHLILCFTHH